MPILNFFNDPEAIMARILIAAFILPFHELAHGWVANKLGDPTAKWMGRLTLNPIKHLDPVGSILLILTGYGWAKPVPINPRNFRNPRKGMAITAAAGPIANLLIALAFMILYKIAVYAIAIPMGGVPETGILYILLELLFNVMWVNVGLAVFNLFPIPPLDGSRIVGLFLPERIYYQITRYEQYIMYGFMALIMFTSILDGPLSWCMGKVYWLLDMITSVIDMIGGLLI